MRILRLATNYPEYLADFKHRHPGIESLAHEEQHGILMADRFSWSDAWTHALAPLGISMWEPVANFESAQQAWARSRGVRFHDSDWLTSISFAQAQEFRPDILFVDDYGTFTPGFVGHLRQRIASIRAVVYWCGAPLDDLTQVAPADLVLSNLPGLVDYLNRAGKPAQVFRHAFDRRVLDEIGAAARKRVALSFVGSIVRRANYHFKREQLLTALAAELDLSVFSSVRLLPEPVAPPKRILQRVLSPVLERRSYVLESNAQRALTLEHTRRRALEELPENLLAKLRPAVFGLEMYRVLRDSVVTVNIHLDYFGESAANMRLFEATGVGCCLLTDWKYDLESQFAADELVSFRSLDECIEKGRQLLGQPDRAENIGRAGQRRTLREHTFEHRAPELADVFRRLM